MEHDTSQSSTEEDFKASSSSTKDVKEDFNVSSSSTKEMNGSPAEDLSGKCKTVKRLLF